MRSATRGADLALPRWARHAADYIAFVDRDLRLRPSIDDPGFFVLERRCRRAPPIHTGRRSGSDRHVQARDGYIHVSTVNPCYIGRPWRMIQKLREDGEDTWVKGAQAIADEWDYDEAWRRETDRRKRHEEWVARARDMYTRLERQGNNDGTEVTRISNIGLPPRGDPNVDSPDPPDRSEGVQLHDHH